MVVMNLCNDERALYAELAVRLARRMVESSDYYLERSAPLTPDTDFEGCIIDPGMTGDFQECWRALFEMGILQPVQFDPSPWVQEATMTPWGGEPVLASFFRLKFGAEGLREYVASTLPTDAPTLSRLIESFAWLIVGWNYGIPARREAFTVPPDFERLFELFERCGYVEHIGDKVGWTDKIAPEMKAAGKWTEGLISEDEAEDALAERMWRTMPEQMRGLVLSMEPDDHLGLMIVISQFWENGKWRDIAFDAGKGEITLRDAPMGLARKLAEKFRKTGD